MRLLRFLLGMSLASTLALAACGDDETGEFAGDRPPGSEDDGSGNLPPRKDPVIPTEHPRIYMGAEAKARLAAKLSGKTPAAERFRKMVDAQLGGADFYGFQPWNAALLGALGGDAKYCTYAISETDKWVSEEEKKINAKERAQVAADSYLEVGDIVGNLATVYDHCFATLTADQKTRWIAYANQAVWNVWNPEKATWGGASHPWNGWSIDNPYNNYHYSFLRATMLLGLATYGETPEAAGHVDTFRKDKLAKLFAAFEQNLQGGGSREGTGYGTSHRTLFELYDFWEATTGERVWDLTAHTRTSLAYFIHMVVPTMDRLAPLGDHARDSTAAFFDYHREQVLALQHLVGGDRLGAVAQTFLEGTSVKEMEQRFEFVWDFLYADPAHAKEPLSKLERTYYASGTGVTFFRSTWEKDATWGALVGGPFTESHAHHDQGSLLFYKNSWLGYDANIESASGIQQGEELHNLVRLEKDGETLRMQESKNPGKTIALSDNANVMYWSGKLDALYGNPAVKRVERDVVFVKPLETFIVFDRIDADVTSSIWQLNAPASPTEASGKWSVAGTGGTGLDIFLVRPSGASGTVRDWPGMESDVRKGFRLDVSSGGHTRYLTVLAAKGRVQSATGAEAGAQTTATIAFASGVSGTVSFSTDGPGGHVTVNGGGLNVDQDLAAGVAAPAIFAP